MTFSKIFILVLEGSEHKMNRVKVDHDLVGNDMPLLFDLQKGTFFRVLRRMVLVGTGLTLNGRYIPRLKIPNWT